MAAWNNVRTSCPNLAIKSRQLQYLFSCLFLAVDEREANRIAQGARNSDVLRLRHLLLVFSLCMVAIILALDSLGVKG
jgi:hypothetical protein